WGGERGEQHPGIAVCPGQKRGPVQRHSRLSCPGGTGDPGWPAIAPLDQLALSRVQEDRPPVPRIFERSGQLFVVADQAKAAQRVWLLEGAGGRHALWNTWLRTGSEGEQRLRGFIWQVIRE